MLFYGFFMLNFANVIPYPSNQLRQFKGHLHNQTNAKAYTSNEVSKNITVVLENLLKNYRSSQLPNEGRGEPTIIKTNIAIQSMGPLSELDMDYSMDCYFRQFWRDSRLSFKGPIESLSLSIKMLERIWRPDTYFYNGKFSYVHTITVPNKFLRISQDGDIKYSMRLTIKAKCPMELKNFPMDRQSCPLVLGSYAYPSKKVVYEWQGVSSENRVEVLDGMSLSQFDLISRPSRNFTLKRREGYYSLLQVNFNLQRNTGYFIIQIYVPCILIVVLSWVSFWIHREATSDRLGLGITTVLTLSTISLNSRKDLPKVRYATALDWFLVMCFFYCSATLLEFAGVYYFTKVSSGEVPSDDDWEDVTSEEETDNEDPENVPERKDSIIQKKVSIRRISGTYQTMTTEIVECTLVDKQSQTENRISNWKQVFYCLIGDVSFKKRRLQEAFQTPGHINSVSKIDRASRLIFPVSFLFLNVFYWYIYIRYQEEFQWKNPPAVGV